MYKILPAAAATCLLAFAGMSPALAGPPDGQICAPLDSGKIDVSGDMQTVTITAPEGMVIDEVCVKAGSVQQGLGAKYTSEYEGLSTATISYPGGKDISHYSVSYTPDEPCDPVVDISCDPYGSY